MSLAKTIQQLTSPKHKVITESLMYNGKLKTNPPPTQHPHPAKPNDRRNYLWSLIVLYCSFLNYEQIKQNPF